MLKLRSRRASGFVQHTVSLRWDGEGQVAYQLVQRWAEARAGVTDRADGNGSSRDGAIAISTTINPSMRTGETAIEMVEVTVHRDAPHTLEMPIITVGVPPGCDVDMEELDGLVGKKGVERVERTQREVTFYLSHLEPDTFVQLPIWLTPRFPMTAQIPPARVYEYYQSDYGATASPKTLTVRRTSDDDELRSR